MLEKIWIISLTLIALFNGVKLEELHTEYLDTDKPIDVSGYKNFTVCMHIKDDLKKDDTFYLIIACDEKGAKLRKNYIILLEKNLAKKQKNLKWIYLSQKINLINMKKKQIMIQVIQIKYTMNIN